MRTTMDAKGRFPFTETTTCYIEVADDGTVSQHNANVHAGQDGVRNLVHAATRARAGTSRLYAVWPGKRRSDLFEVNLRQMALEFGWTWGEEGEVSQV